MAQKFITAGAALSLSGRFSVQGEQAHRGLTLWAEHVNRQGGLRVELRIVDDGSKIAGASAGTERLIAEDRVDLLFSPYGSVLTLAAAEVAERHGRVLWNHGGSSDALEQRGWRHVVTLLSPASRYFGPVLDMAVGRPVSTVALLHGATGTFPQAVIGGARERAENLGLEVVLDEPYPPSSAPTGEHSGARDAGARDAGARDAGARDAGARDAGARDAGAMNCAPTGAGPVGAQFIAPSPGEGLPQLVARLATLRPDLILGVGTTEADLAFASELRRQGLKSRLVALVAAPIERFRKVLGSDADGFCGPSQWEPTLGGQSDLGPTSAAFSADFRARFGVEPDYPATQAYAAGLIAAHCVEQAGSLEDDALRQAAGALDLTTCYGRFRLDPRTGRQVGHTIVVAQWQAGQKTIVWPAAVATAPFQWAPS